MKHDIHRLTALAFATVLAAGAQAFEVDTGSEDFKLRWDNTVKYSAATRLKSRSPALATTARGPGGVVVGPNNLNQDDGDNNFAKGWVSNRLDLFSEADISFRRDLGARISGAAWYDAVYQQHTDNRTASSNHSPASDFPDETRRVMGRKAEWLDAFVYAKGDIGDTPVSARLGRHSLLWGESLFFGANGIAGGQAPVDLVKLTTVPNSQFKETVRPTGKLSAQVQVGSDASIGAYVGYEWERSRFIPVGSYLSATDVLGPGAEIVNTGPGGIYRRGGEVTPAGTGQGGLQFRFRAWDADFGLYAIRYHATAPSNLYFTRSAVAPGVTAANSFQVQYHEGIRAYGLSAAKTLEEWSLAGEVSYRQNTPLSSFGQTEVIGVSRAFDTRSNPSYAVGESVHAQFSWVASLGPSFVSQEASFLGEIAWNARTRFTTNAQYANPLADRSAVGLRMVYTPTYRQVIDGLDLAPSVGIGVTRGRSSAVGPGFGVDRGGDMNVGITGTYLDRWIAALNYVHYFGPEGGSLDNAQFAQFKQALKDRDYLTLSVRTTF
jgi:hypothetical protein